MNFIIGEEIFKDFFGIPTLEKEFGLFHKNFSQSGFQRTGSPKASKTKGTSRTANA